jgi:hypothetical protein
MLHYKLEPVEKDFWLLFKMLFDGKDYSGTGDMGSDIIMEFHFLEHNEEEAEWFVSRVGVDCADIEEFADVGIEILQQLKDHVFTSNVMSIIEFAENNMKAYHDNRIFSYRLLES